MLSLENKVDGFTTNPSLIRATGITDYKWFAHDVLAAIKTKPISFEVVTDDLATMERQARTIASWADNIYVKIPVTLTDGTSTLQLASYLSQGGVKVNVTAVFTAQQIERATSALAHSGTPSCVSVFAGRIADAGIDPVPLIKAAVICAGPDTEIIWASTREVYNVVQARQVGCHIITVSPELLAKTSSLGKDLEQFSLETVAQFASDATAAGLSLG